jgi:hypothetical protein
MKIRQKNRFYLNKQLVSGGKEEKFSTVKNAIFSYFYCSKLDYFCNNLSSLSNLNL